MFLSWFSKPLWSGQAGEGVTPAQPWTAQVKRQGQLCSGCGTCRAPGFRRTPAATSPARGLSCCPSNNIRAWKQKKNKNYRLPVDGLTSHVSILGQRDKKKKKGKTIHQVPGNSPSALCGKMLPTAGPMWIHLKRWEMSTSNPPVHDPHWPEGGAQGFSHSPRWLNSATP